MTRVVKSTKAKAKKVEAKIEKLSDSAIIKDTLKEYMTSIQLNNEDINAAESLNKDLTAITHDILFRRFTI